jgi:hypothetical protein
MGYTWVYVHNRTGSAQKLVMGVASDDGIQVEVNRSEARTAMLGRKESLQSEESLSLLTARYWGLTAGC